MSAQTFLDYTAAEHLQDFLQLQSQNADLIQDYTNSNTRFSAGLGLVIQPIGPVGDFVTDQGVMVAGWVSDFFDTVARQVGQVTEAVQQADEEAMAELWSLTGDLPDATGGGIMVFAHPEVQPTGPGTMPAPLTLSAPTPGDDPMPGIRSRLGPIVSIVDEVYSRLIGNGSLVEQYLFQPLAGEWDTIQEAADAWRKAGAGYSSMAEYLVGYSLPVDWWEGVAAEAFRTLMGLAQTVADWMRWAHEMVGSGVDFVAQVVTTACERIADIIGYLERIATRILAKLKIPLIGWAQLAWRAKGYIDEFRGHVEDIKEIIAEVEAVIADALDMRDRFVERVDKARELYSWVTSAT